MQIGTKIKELRINKGLKATDLAKKSYISQPYLSDIERGRTSPSLDKLASICDALGTTLSEFFADEPLDIPNDLRLMIEAAKDLTPEQQQAFTDLMKTIKNE